MDRGTFVMYVIALLRADVPRGIMNYELGIRN